MRRSLAATVLALTCAPAGARAGDAPAAPFDAENPRNVRFEGPVIETVRATPRATAGGRVVWPPGTEVRFEVVARRLPSAGAGPAAPDEDEPTVRLDGVFRAPLHPVEGTYWPWRAEPDRHVLEVAWGRDRGAFATDALRVRLLVERRTFDAGERRFGSFVRRFRKSLDDLHALFAASVHPLAPQGVLERFRIDDVRVYDRVGDERPPGFDGPLDADVVVACDEGGPLGGPAGGIAGSSILHTFRGVPGHEGLWSSWGEQALWLGLLRSRRLPNLRSSEIEAGALPGRFERRVPLPERFAKDLLAAPAGTPLVSEYTAVFANRRRGVARPGDPDDPQDVVFGHVWNFLPGRVVLAPRAGGQPLEGAVVRWWRALPTPREGSDPVAGVAADRAPDGEATTDARGTVAIVGDYLGRGDTAERRSRWLLVEVRRGEERRFEILYGLDLNLAYVRGAKYVHAVPLDFEDLIPVGATSLPAGR